MCTPIHKSLKGHCQQQRPADHSLYLRIKVRFGNRRFLVQGQQIPDSHSEQDNFWYLPQIPRRESGHQAE